MPKITSVEPQKKNPHRFNIFIDSEFAFGADEDLVVEKRLIVGKIIEKTDLEKLLFESEVGKLMERMYGLWNIRQRSEKEVRDYLKRLSFKRKVKGDEEISQQAVELLISKLKQKKLLSDEEFARAWVEARRKTKIKGKIAIKRELFQKGIDKKIIDQVLADQQNDRLTEEELAQKLLEKKMKNWSPLSYLEKKRRAYQILIRYGFEYDTVSPIIEKFLQKE